MLTALVLSAMLGQTAVATNPSTQEIESHSVLAPITIVPVRELRKNIISYNMGFNSSGVLSYTRNTNPYFAVDTSLGLTQRGAEIGVRGRWNMLNRNLTPFLGLGVAYGTGWPIELTQRDLHYGSSSYAMRILPSPLAQATLGLSWQTRKGLSLMGMVGWNQLLRATNVKYVKGERPSDSEQKVNKFIFGSAPIVAFNIGYAF